MEDLHAVLDAAGSARTVILASHEGCGMAALYAATYPERTPRWPSSILCRARGRGSREARAGWRIFVTAGGPRVADEIMRDGCPPLPERRGSPLVRELAPRRRQPRGRIRPQPGLRGDRPAGRTASRARADASAPSSA